MWTRKLLKDNARIVLQRRFSTLLLAVIIEQLITGITAELSGRTLLFRLNDTLFHTSSGWHLTGLLAIDVFCLTAITQFFIAPLLKVGKNRFMMESRQGNAPLSTLFSVFQDDYWHVFCVQFVVSLQIALWSLLLIIPGIYKGLQYSMVPYLLAENPNLSLARAKKLSAQMTEGEKWNIVLLNLSFIGWALLAALTAQILGLFLPPIVSGVVGWLLLPYVEATWAELYAVMRAKAIQLGFSNTDELGGFIRY